MPIIKGLGETPPEVKNKTEAMLDRVKISLGEIKGLYDKTNTIVVDNIARKIKDTLGALYPKETERSYTPTYLQRTAYRPQMLMDTYDFYSVHDEIHAYLVDFDRLALEAQDGQIRIKLLIDKLLPASFAYENKVIESLAKEVGESTIAKKLKLYYKVIIKSLKDILGHYRTVNADFKWILSVMVMVKEAFEDHPAMAEELNEIYKYWKSSINNVLKGVKDPSQKIYNDLLKAESKLQGRIKKKTLRDSYEEDGVEKKLNGKRENKKAGEKNKQQDTGVTENKGALDVLEDVLYNIMYVLC